MNKAVLGTTCFDEGEDELRASIARQCTVRWNKGVGKSGAQREEGRDVATKERYREREREKKKEKERERERDIYIYISRVTE